MISPRALVRKALSDQMAERLSRAKAHAARAGQALSGTSSSIAADSSLELTDTWRFLEEAVRRYRNADSGERRSLKLALLKRAILDPYVKRAVHEKYFANVTQGSDLLEGLRGASLYGDANPTEAGKHFASAVEIEPDALNFYALGRCLGVGCGDNHAAADILRVGVQRHPHDMQIRLALASAEYRGGSAEAANVTLRDGGAPLRSLFKQGQSEALRTAGIIGRAAQEGVAAGTPNTEEGYGENSVRPYWERLWFHMVAANEYQHGWAGLTHVFQSRLASVLERNPQIRKVVNFGVFCAHPDYQLALRFPNVHFIGIDLQNTIKSLNDAAFSAPNLSFYAGDILRLLPEVVRPDDAALLFHARTANLCYPELVRSVYRCSKTAGVEFIALWENDSLARTTLRYYELDEIPAVPPLYSSSQILHNYSAYLGDAGYGVVDYERAPSNKILLEDDEGDADGHTFMVGRSGAQSNLKIGRSLAH